MHAYFTRAQRRALAKGLIAFAKEIGSTITAEGVETEAELATLRAIGVDKVPGYYLSKPQSLADVQLLIEQRRGGVTACRCLRRPYVRTGGVCVRPSVVRRGFPLLAR